MFGGQPPGFRRVPTDYAAAMRTLYGKGAQAAPSDRARGRRDITECAASQAPCRARASRRAIGRADPSLASGPEPLRAGCRVTVMTEICFLCPKALKYVQIKNSSGGGVHGYSIRSREKPYGHSTGRE